MEDKNVTISGLNSGLSIFKFTIFAIYPVVYQEIPHLVVLCCVA